MNVDEVVVDCGLVLSVDIVARGGWDCLLYTWRKATGGVLCF